MTDDLNKGEFINTTENFGKLLDRANSIQEVCEDFKVAANDVRMNADMCMMFDNHIIPMSSLARGELCGKLFVPSRYITRCIESNNSALAAENLNCWLQDNQKKLFIRNSIRNF